MSTEYGVWSHRVGGFAITSCFSVEQAAHERDALVAHGEDYDDLEIRDVCPDHEQPADACAQCWVEPEDDTTRGTQ